jgi:hypothetical protein
MCAGLILASDLALAGPADYIYTPAVEFGEKEIDFKAGSASKDNDPRESAYSLGFGYGANEWWFTELYGKYKNEDNSGAKYDAVEWENKFQLTETGRYPVDLGVILEIERPQNRAEGWEVKWGPLLQTEYDKFQLNANLLFQRNYRADFANSTEFGYQWQMKYRWKQEFEFGLQVFGDMGPWSDWSPANEQVHLVGPAVFGKIELGNHQALRYNAAWLSGSSTAAPDHTWRLQVEFEF